ncbi:hypothetical protein FF38_14260 [Lucilia cuprina]|uniref:Uncharacterized protein n=1 Tax=Lucilia cuprina TaxID=7375 RepID=A0A0L0CR39_LUCCU|nr:hypothetical protein FF38_14260 [Lucilia cuprina]
MLCVCQLNYLTTLRRLTDFTVLPHGFNLFGLCPYLLIETLPILLHPKMHYPTRLRTSNGHVLVVDPLIANCNPNESDDPLFISIGYQNVRGMNTKSYKAEFEEIKKDFSALQDNFTASPKPKRKRTAKPSSPPPKDLSVAAVNNIQCAVTESPIQKQNPYPDQIPTPVSPKQITVTPSPTLNTVTYVNVVLDQNSNIAPANLSVVPPKSVTVNPITNTHTPEITPLPSTSSNVSTNMNASNQPINSFSAVSTPKPVKTIPPRKTIFATRFALDTTVNDVDYHIKSNLGMELYNDVQVFKINARNRASFKIIVPESIYDRLVHPKF